MAVRIPAQAVADAQAADGELWPMLLALAGPESGWDPGAQGDWKFARGGPRVPNGTPGASPYSFGYLQMNTDGGFGDGYSPAQLLDGAFNMRLGAQYLRGRLSAGASEWDAMSPWSARPAASELLARIRAEGIESDGVPVSPPGGGNGKPGGDNPPVQGAGPAVLIGTIVVLFALGVI